VDDPIGFFLAGYPERIVTIAERLRAIVHEACPDASERLRSGWALVGYDLPVGKKKRYFAFIAPEQAHIHLGFEYGAWMSDPERRLEGAHLKLKKVRYLTFEPSEILDRRVLTDLIREGARAALLSNAERLGRALDRESRS
jgi:hypothetical protein